jgi:S1-C subfamily serine protease
VKALGLRGAPEMSDKQLYVRVRGKVTGPFEFQQLRSLRDRGQFRRFHEVSEDRKLWVSASTISELFPGSVPDAPASPEMPPTPPLDQGTAQVLTGDIEGSQEIPSVPVQFSPYKRSPARGHSMVGIFATVGAGVMFGVILVFVQICQSQADKISQTPGMNLSLAQQKFDTMSTVAKVIGISSVATSLIWIALSFRSPSKKLWNIIGCVANGVLLIWILFNPMAIQVANLSSVHRSSKSVTPERVMADRPLSKSATAEEITENYREWVYSIRTDTSLGSGILLANKGKRGLIATNLHVISPALDDKLELKKIFADQVVKINVSVKNPTQLNYAQARVAAIHRRLDLALLINELSAEEYGVRVIRQRSLKQGEAAVALGNPRALEFFTSNGVISSTSGEMGYIWTTCPLSSGNSGGPLILSRRGLLAGINTIASSGQQPGVTQNLNGAVPAEEIIMSLRNKQSDNWIWAPDLKELTFDLAELVILEE